MCFFSFCSCFFSAVFFVFQGFFFEHFWKRLAWWRSAVKLERCRLVDKSKRSPGSSRRSRRETKPVKQEKINHETEYTKIAQHQYTDKVVEVTVVIQEHVSQIKRCTDRVGERDAISEFGLNLRHSSQ